MAAVSYYSSQLTKSKQVVVLSDNQSATTTPGRSCSAHASNAPGTVSGVHGAQRLQEHSHTPNPSSTSHTSYPASPAWLAKQPTKSECKASRGEKSDWPPVRVLQLRCVAAAVVLQRRAAQT